MVAARETGGVQCGLRTRPRHSLGPLDFVRSLQQREGFESMIGRRCVVRGRVQGVWFRDSTRRRALQLGISGSAVNRPDGSVEVIASGDPEYVQALCDWLWEGSPMSEVDSVECEPWAGTVQEGFFTG